MSTCRVGPVADEHFRLRGVKGIRIGSGAVLPEIPEANPHLTISAFSVALAYSVLKEHCPLQVVMDAESFTLKPLNIKNIPELLRARTTLEKNEGKCIINRVDNVVPDLRHIVQEHENLLANKKD
jgi:hypothetical protein